MALTHPSSVLTLPLSLPFSPPPVTLSPSVAPPPLPLQRGGSEGSERGGVPEAP